MRYMRYSVKSIFRNKHKKQDQVKALKLHVNNPSSDFGNLEFRKPARMTPGHKVVSSLKF